MRKSLIFCLGLLLGTTILAQETVVWGAEVLDVSSEYGPLEYSALQVLHKPNVLPRGGDDPNAWRPKREDKTEFITVAFDEPITAKQVAIAETENPGAVSRVLAYDEDYNEYVLFELVPRALPIESRLLNLFFEETTYKIQAISVELDGAATPGFNSIDAIGISASNIPINVLIEIVSGVNRNIQAENLGENVNSQYIEHSPIISPDGKKLYFSRRYHPDNIGGVDDQEDIWVSELDEESGQWLPAKNIGPPLNTVGPNFISSISVIDGEEVLILGNRYGKKGRMYTGTSMSTFKDGEYEKPVSLEVENEYNYSPKADFFLTPNGDALIQALERDDSYGGRDLYISFKESRVKWSEPKNLGGILNTIGEEASPFLAKDNKTLYFSSGGHAGYGGLDIYVTRRLDDTWLNWSAPENMGSGINTDLDDEYFSIPSSGKHLYFTRGKVDDDTDIFRFTVEEFFVDPESPIYASVEHLEEEDVPVVITVMGTVTNSKTGAVLPLTPVVVKRLPDGVAIGSVDADDQGAYSFSVRPGARFSFGAEKDGFIPQNENIDLNDIDKSDTIIVDLKLSPIEVGEPIILKNIFFEFDKDVLRTASYPELDKLLGYMQDGQIKRIEISGHTDWKGPGEYNQKLSERRAKAVRKYLIQNGIEEGRMEYAGYGESQPIDTNETVEGRQNNRRVEFKILEAN